MDQGDSGQNMAATPMHVAEAGGWGGEAHSAHNNRSEADDSFNTDTNMAVTVVATCSNLDLVANPE